MPPINNTVRQTPQLMGHSPVQPSHIKAPSPSSEIKVKSRTSQRMQELQKAVKEKGHKVVGSKAQIALIKAQIEAVKVPDIRDQSAKVPLSKTETAKKYGLIVGRVLLGLGTAGISELVINRKTIGDKISRTASNSVNGLAISVSLRYTSAGKQAEDLAKIAGNIIDLDHGEFMLERDIKRLTRDIDRLKLVKPRTPEVQTELENKLEERAAKQNKLVVVKSQLKGLRTAFYANDRIKEALAVKANLSETAQTFEHVIDAGKKHHTQLELAIRTEKEAHPNGVTPKLKQLTRQLAAVKDEIKKTETKLEPIKQVLNRHSSDNQTLLTLKQELTAQAKGDKAKGNEILGGAKGIIGDYAFNGTLTLAKAGHSMFSLINSGSQLVAHVKAVSQGTSSALEITHHTKDVAAASIGVSTSTITTLGLIAAPVTIAVEAYSLQSTLKHHSRALNKVEKAEAMLNLKSRETLKKSFQKQLQKAEKGSTFSKPNPEKAAILRAKIEALDKLPQPQELSQESQAVAKQIIKRADLGYKRHSAFKSTMAIAAASLTIASLAMGPAAPVGLAVAATVLGVAAGAYGIALLVKKFTIPRSRKKKIETLTNNHQQIQMKKQALSTQKGQLSAEHSEKSKIKQYHSEKLKLLKKFQSDGQVPGPEDLEKFHLSADDFAGGKDSAKVRTLVVLSQSMEEHMQTEMTLLENGVKTIDTNLGRLSDLQARNTLSLLSCSPHDAAAIIYKGATDTPPDSSMAYLAKDVLGVDCHSLSPDVAREQLARGMSLKPEK